MKMNMEHWWTDESQITNISELGSYLTVNTVYVNYKDQPVNAVQGNNGIRCETRTQHINRLCGPNSFTVWDEEDTIWNQDMYISGMNIYCWLLQTKFNCRELSEGYVFRVL